VLLSTGESVVSASADVVRDHDLRYKTVLQGPLFHSESVESESRSLVTVGVVTGGVSSVLRVSVAISSVGL